jgi:hypothetical protein
VERVVAGEQLVGAVAAHRHRDLGARVLAQQVVGSSELSPIGSSRRETIDGSRARALSIDSTSLKCVVPSSRATWFEYCDSSKLASSKPMLKVRTLERSMWRVAIATDRGGIDAARKEEPQGHVGHQAALHRGRQQLEQLLAPDLLGLAGMVSNGSITKSQYFHTLSSRVARSKVSEWPPGSRFTPSRMVVGAGM